jgi:acyl-CoA reductase-like NAD-dependent aldehyde dehydrogenase
MTATNANSPREPRAVDLRETRSRFLLARAQTAAHVSTAEYLHLREMGRYAAPAMTQGSPRPPARDYKMLMGGTWIDARSGQRYESSDPSSGKAWATAPAAAADDVDRVVGAARKAFDSGPWRTMATTERAHLMRRLAELIGENAEALARVESTDGGRLLRQVRAQLEAVPEWYYYAAGAAEKLEGAAIPSDKPNFLVYTRREPIGVVGMILPWSSPILLLSWKLAPALAAGCTVVAKPAEQSFASTLELAGLFEEAGFPPGVFNVVTGGATAARALVRHPGVDKIAITGSSDTGGTSPNIVFDDADLGAARDGVIAGLLAATGQPCIAGSRLLVHEKAHDELLGRLAQRARTIELGDPLDPRTEMGPLASKEQLDEVQHQIRLAREEGADLVCGGMRPRRAELHDGYFIEPAIFTNVHSGMTIAREEIVGPILSVTPFKDEDDLVRQANATPFGLAAGVWTADVRRAHRLAQALPAGTVWTNAYRTVSFDTPFGGFKMSGAGRESGLESLNEYTRAKAVWVELPQQPRDPLALS